MQLRTILAIVLLPWVASSAQLPDESAKRGALEELRLLRQADGLHKLAVLHGGNYSRIMYGIPWVRHDSLSALAGASDLIVRVDVESNRCALVSDGKAILTRYEAKIDDVYRGALMPGATLLVVLAGGKYRFSDGTSAQVDVPSQRRLLNGHQYILFLRSGGGDDYAPVGGDEGVFEISSSSQVIPFASGVNAPLQNERNFNLRQMQERIFEAIKGAKETAR